MTRHAAAYIRRSSVSGDSPGDASRDAQLAAVRGLCGDEVEVYSDWGISGQKADRPDYVRLKADIEAGRVGSVCAYSLSRLGRSVRELLIFVDLCRAQNVTIRTKVENIDTSTAMGTFTFTLFAAIAELEAELARERSAAARAAKRERGDRFGHAPYGYMHVRDEQKRIVRVPDPDEPIQPIIDAYRAAGSVLGACRLLERDGIAAPAGGKRWATSALTRILEREAPEFLPRRTVTGRRTPASAPLTALLACPFCGRRLTPNVARKQYYCANGPRDRASHPRYAVREQDVMPFVRVEAARYRAPDVTIEQQGIEQKRDAIQMRIDRAQEFYLSGEFDRTRFDAEKARAQQDLDDLAGRVSVATLHPEVDFDVEPDVVNAALRAIWREVRFDQQMRPIDVEWIFPELRG